MPAQYGRKVTLTWGGNPILGVREKGLTLNGEAVNVTSDEDDGYQYLLNEDAERSIEIALSGVTKDEVLRAAKMAGNIQAAVVMTYPNGAVISGTFNLAAYSEGQPYNEAITFQATLQSTGEWTYTPGS